MFNDEVHITIADLEGVNPLTELQQFWYAILSFKAFEFYVLLNENIKLYGYTKQTFTEKLNRKITAHQYFGDHEYILVIEKEELLKNESIICDFMGCVNTGFSTKLKFDLNKNRVIGISFIEDEYDIGKVVDLYSLEEIQNRVFDRWHKN